MKLFLTGATGFIGQAIAHRAIASGHQLTALVRTEASAPAAALAEIGVALHLGDLREPQSFARATGAGRVAEQIFNVVAEEAVAVTAIGEAIRASVGADRLERWPLGVARQSLGPFADALALDQAMSGHLARQVLAWTPRASTAIADLSAQEQFWRADGE